MTRSGCGTAMKTTPETMHVRRKYRRLSMYYDPLFSTLERIVFSGSGNNPRLALAGKVPAGDLSVLDVCSGTGRGALPVAASGVAVTGIDLSPEMLAVARKKIAKQNIGNVSLHEMDATAMTFPDEQFDVAMSSFALHEMKHELMMQVLMEIRRVLKQGGRLYLVEFEKDVRPWIQAIFGVYTRLSYPASVQAFFELDWSEVLARAGFELDGIEKYRISKIVCATKTS